MIIENLFLIGEKLLLGVSLAAPIGPVSAEMIKRGLKNGFWAAFNVRLGGAIGNSLCLIAAFFGLSALTDYKMTVSLIALMGAGLLLYMGINTIRKAFKTVDLKTNTDSESKTNYLSNSLGLGFILAIANPIAIAFWISLGAAGLNNVNIESASPVATGIDIIGFLQNFLIIGGVLLWGATLSLTLEFGRRFVTDKILKIVTGISGTILLYFGCKYALNGANQLLLLM